MEDDEFGIERTHVEFLEQRRTAKNKADLSRKKLKNAREAEKLNHGIFF